MYLLVLRRFYGFEFWPDEHDTSRFLAVLYLHRYLIHVVVNVVVVAVSIGIAIAIAIAIGAFVKGPFKWTKINESISMSLN